MYFFGVVYAQPFLYDALQASDIVDAQGFSVRQRRNLVWGCIQRKTGDLGSFRKCWQRALLATKCSVSFPMEEWFEMGLPSQPLRIDREGKLVAEALDESLEVF